MIKWTKEGKRIAVVNGKEIEIGSIKIKDDNEAKNE